jgi:hypothetical protein
VVGEVNPGLQDQEDEQPKPKEQLERALFKYLNFAQTNGNMLPGE